MTEILHYRYEKQARTQRTLAILGAWWAMLAVLYFGLGAHPGIVAVLLLFSLPAVYDYGANATATLELTDRDIRWSSGRRSGAMPRAQIKRVRLDTRLDLSVRMTLETHQGGKLRLPYECVPKLKSLEAGLRSADIPFQRHAFSLIG